MKHYLKKISDDLLVMLIRNNSPEAEKALVNKYKGFSIILAKEVLENCAYRELIDIDDLVGCGLETLFKSIENYKNSDGRFYYYWKKCAKKEMVRYLKENENYFKILALYNHEDAQFSSPAVVDERNYLYDEIAQFVLVKENGFTDQELKIFFMFMDGYDIDEIAFDMKTNRRKIYYIIGKARDKVRQYLYRDIK